MSITHFRFPARLNTQHRAAAPKAHRGWGHAKEAESPSPQASLTSYPWEGLYLDADQIAPPASPPGPVPANELEQFLTGLMYGE